MEQSLIVAALTTQPPTAERSPVEWTQLLRQARILNVLPQLARRYEHVTGVPLEVARHFESARRIAERLALDVHREARRISTALQPLNIPVVFLKGGAYVLRDLAAAHGRVFSDLDLMVPRDAVAAAEDRLIRAGWVSSHHDAYDQRYYRQWMHEIPPLRHLHRGTIVDLHHTITPPTSRFPVQGEKLLATAYSLSLASFPNGHTLGNTDMVLHAAVHRFMEGEWANGFRDLLDLHRLLEEFGKDADFGRALLARSQELGLEMPLRQTLHQLKRIFATPLPPALEIATRPGPVRPGERLTAMLLSEVLTPQEPDSKPPERRRAAALLYLRAHWLRMPPHLLAAHLLRKALRPTHESTA